MTVRGVMQRARDLLLAGGKFDEVAPDFVRDMVTTAFNPSEWDDLIRSFEGDAITAYVRSLPQDVQQRLSSAARTARQGRAAPTPPENQGPVSRLALAQAEAGGEPPLRPLKPDEMGILPQKGPIGVAADVFETPVSLLGQGLAQAVEDLNTLYRGFTFPATAAVTAGSVTQAEGGSALDQLKRLAQVSTWTEGASIAWDERRYLHEALILAAGTEDITDPEQVRSVLEADWYPWAAIPLDFAIGFVADPLVVLGKASTAARIRTGTLTQPTELPIRTAADVERIVTGKRAERIVEESIGRPAAEIERKFLARHEFAQDLAPALADAETVEQGMEVMRAALGDPAVMRKLADESATVAMKVNRAQGLYESLAAMDEAGVWIANNDNLLSLVERELDELYDTQARVDRLHRSSGTLRSLPTRFQEVRGSMARSQFYREGRMSAPMRLVTDMEPLLVNLHDPTTHQQLTRILERGDKFTRSVARRNRAGEVIGVAREEIDDLTRRYMDATLPPQRAAILEEAEDLVQRRMAEAAGMTPEQARETVDRLRRLRGETKAFLNDSVVFDAEGRGVMRMTDENGMTTVVPLPLWVTQERNFFVPADFRSAQRALKPVGRWAARYQGIAGLAELPEVGLDLYYRWWRPSRLLRFGWPVKILTDEQMRMVSTIGGWQTLNAHIRGLSNVPDAVRARLAGEFHVPGRGDFNIGAYPVQNAFGATASEADRVRRNVSARGAFQELGGFDETRSYRQAFRRGANRSIPFDDPAHGEAWERAVNLQIGQDEMGKVILAGADETEVVDWLRGPGRDYYRRLNGATKPNDPLWRSPEQIAADAIGQADDLLPDPALRALALEGKAESVDLAAAVPDAAHRPNVHGDLVGQVFGGNAFTENANKLVNSLYHAFGSWPTDVLSRNTTFDRLYQLEMRRLVGLLDPDLGAKGIKIADDLMADLRGKARAYALNETRNVMFNIAEASDFAHLARYVAPFYMAFQEVLTVWGRLALRNPAFIGRLNTALRQPYQAGLMTDGGGNKLGPEGEGAVDDERWLTIPWMEEIPPWSVAKRPVNLSIDSFSVVSGFPFSGPIVQLPVNEIVKRRPEWEEFFDLVLPYGVTEGLRQQALAPWMELVASEFSEEEEETQLAMFNRLLAEHMTRWAVGGYKPDEFPSFDDVAAEKDKLFFVHLAGKFALPAAARLLSPYQDVINAYTQARERFFADPTSLGVDEEGNAIHPQEWLIDNFGVEYLALTISATESKNGVPPNQEAFKVAREFEDVIEKYPEYGTIVVGETAGEFSSAVFRHQLRETIREGSDEPQRDRKSPEDVMREYFVTLGWHEAAKVNDLLEIELDRRGADRLDRGKMPTLARWYDDELGRVRELTTVPDAGPAALAGTSPWWEDREAKQALRTDEAQRERFLTAMQEIARHEGLRDRPDIRFIADWLDINRLAAEELAKRAEAAGDKNTTLDAKKHARLKQWYDEQVAALVDANLTGSRVYYRFLDTFEPEAKDLTVLGGS